MTSAPLSADDIGFLALSRVAAGDFGANVSAGRASALRAIAQWMREYLMSAHPDLGRAGDVCPFTSQAARLDALRLAVSDAAADDTLIVRRQMLQAFDAFEAIPHARGMANFRSVLVGFPRCNDASGVAALVAVQKSLRRLSFARARMIGVFYPEADSPGLWNPDFRPLRAPIPLIAIRAMVEQDAAFVMRNPLLAPAYLRHFPFAGARRLVAQVWKRA